jgi:hypothetical protein
MVKLTAVDSLPETALRRDGSIQFANTANSPVAKNVTKTGKHPWRKMAEKSKRCDLRRSTGCLAIHLSTRGNAQQIIDIRAHVQQLKTSRAPQIRPNYNACLADEHFFEISLLYINVVAPRGKTRSRLSKTSERPCLFTATQRNLLLHANDLSESS